MGNNTIRAKRWYDRRPWQRVWNALLILACIPISGLFGFIILSAFLSETQCREVIGWVCEDLTALMNLIR